MTGREPENKNNSGRRSRQQLHRRTEQAVLPAVLTANEELQLPGSSLSPALGGLSLGAHEALCNSDERV